MISDALFVLIPLSFLLVVVLCVSRLAAANLANEHKRALELRDTLLGLMEFTVRDVSRELHLDVEAGVAKGTVDGSAVVLDICQLPFGGGERAFRFGTRIRVMGGPPDLRVSSRTAQEYATTNFAVRTGDPRFDAHVRIGAPTPDDRRAILDEAVRAVVTDAVRATGVFSDGCWTIQMHDITFDVARLVGLIRLLVLASRALASDGEPADERLARIATNDAEPGARLLAVRALGERRCDVLVERLDDPEGAVARAAALRLAELENEDGHRAAEAVLIRFCSDGDGDTIDALARIGTVAAVPLLSRLATGSFGLGVDARRARAAMRTIQARIGTGGGMLAMATVEGGALSVVETAERYRRTRATAAAAPRTTPRTST